MTEEEAREFLQEFGIASSAMDRVIRQSYGLLGLISFFTVGEDEVRAWTIRKGTVAVDAADVIHSDISKGFIRAEVMAYDDLMAAGSQAEARKRGTVRLEGKTYPVQDGTSSISASTSDRAGNHFPAPASSVLNRSNSTGAGSSPAPSNLKNRAAFRIVHAGFIEIIQSVQQQGRVWRGKVSLALPGPSPRKYWPVPQPSPRHPYTLRPVARVSRSSLPASISMQSSAWTREASPPASAIRSSMVRSGRSKSK
jgi:hypothetical protein